MLVNIISTTKVFKIMNKFVEEELLNCVNEYKLKIEIM